MLEATLPDRRTLRKYARYAGLFGWVCIILAALLERMHRVAGKAADQRVRAHNARQRHGRVDPPDPEDVVEDHTDDEGGLDDHPLDADS